MPHWARDTRIGNKLNNARSEGLADKPSFRQALRRRRCILPVSGFYEWQPAAGADGKPAKQPWFISPQGQPCFAMAGLFEAWQAPAAAAKVDDDAETGLEAGQTPAAEWLLTCCVITTAANALMAPIHERMPVLLRPEHLAAWLARGSTDPATLAPLMAGLPETGSGAMQAWPVGPAVGPSSADGAALAEPLDPTQVLPARAGVASAAITAIEAGGG